MWIGFIEVAVEGVEEGERAATHLSPISEERVALLKIEGEL